MTTRRFSRNGFPFWLLVSLLLGGSQPWTAIAQKVLAGNRYPLQLSNPESYSSEPGTAEPRVVWSYLVNHRGATYIALHFAPFDLGPNDYLTVSDVAGTRRQLLRGKGPAADGAFWAARVKGENAVIELVVTGSTRGRGFVLDEYSAGAGSPPGPESIIGWNDLQNAACYRGTPQYERGKAVARLLIHSSDADYWGTGFLVSPQNHLLTAKHLISKAAEAQTAEFEFMAEAPDCQSYNCEGCYSTAVLTGSELVKLGSGLDYTLVRLTSGNPAADYGYLELEERTAVIGEQIYIPQHAGGRAKEFAVLSDGMEDYGVARVQSLSAPSCGGSGLDVGYYADTEGGSSGSPVLALSSHKVIALHHCGGTINAGIPARAILSQIKCNIAVATIDRTEATLPAAGGTVMVNVNGCTWAIDNNFGAWVSVTPRSGAGSKVVTITVRPNNTCAPRQCTLAIAGHAFELSQAAGDGITSIYPASATFGAPGGPGELKVFAYPECPWTPSSSANWVTITDVASQGEEVVVRYSVSPMPDATARSAAIHIQGRSFPVSQFSGLASANPGTYSGLFAEPGAASHERSGLLKLTVTATATYSGSLQMGSSRYTFSGKLDANGQIAKVITRRNDTPLELSLVPTTWDRFSGSVSSGAWTASADAKRAAYDGKTKLSPQQGPFTLEFKPLETSSGLPAGSGYATLKIDKAGRVTLAGSLADGTKISQSGVLDAAGEWPIYVPLAGGKGSLLGQAGVCSDRELRATLRWSKPALISAVYYPAGFVTTLSARGCDYVAGAFESKALGIDKGEVTFGDGGLPYELSISFSLGAKNKLKALTGSPLSLSFSSSGVFTGRMRQPDTTAWVSFKGVVLQHWNVGAGYFLNAGSSGWMRLEQLTAF